MGLYCLHAYRLPRLECPFCQELFGKCVFRNAALFKCVPLYYVNIAHLQRLGDENTDYRQLIEQDKRNKPNFESRLQVHTHKDTREAESYGHNDRRSAVLRARMCSRMNTKDAQKTLSMRRLSSGNISVITNPRWVMKRRWRGFK